MNDSYELFVNKFKPKKTTDDCYTPPEIYEAIKSYVVHHYNWEGRRIIRPFYPGSDYEHVDYSGGVVIDNPPFSIISKIVAFYELHHIDYFLFAPHLTLLGIKKAHSHIGVGAAITYENGAKVNTSFIASKGPLLCSSPELYRIIDTINKKTKAGKHLPSYDYPPQVMTSSRLAMMSKYGMDFEREHGVFIRTLESQKPFKKGIYGSGYLIQDNGWHAKLEHAKLEHAKLKHAKIWRLSPDEKRLVERLENE